MERALSFIGRWGSCILVMMVIFAFSATPASNLPRFGSLDYYVKKGGHMLGYGLLALSYRHALAGREYRGRMAWILAVLYATLDEFHQSFIPGRHPSALDVLLFDATGAAIALLTINHFSSK